MSHDFLQVVEIKVREVTLLLEERLLFKLLQWAGLGGGARREGMGLGGWASQEGPEDEIKNMLSQR